MSAAAGVATVTVVDSAADSAFMARQRNGPIRWLRTHPLAADALLAVGLTALTLTLHLVNFDPVDDYRDATWWTPLLVIASVFPILWRRRSPTASTVFVVVAEVTSSFLDIGGSGGLGVVIAIYSLGAHGQSPQRNRVLGGCVALIALLFVAGVLVDELSLGSFISSTVILVTAFVLGDNLRRRREAADALAERLERAERERELLAEQRGSAERARIARELHDVVAHSVTGMVIQAEAARRTLDRSPSDARAALDEVSATGRQAMTELRSVLGVLRRENGADDGAELEPQPGIARLAELVASAGDLPVPLDVRGLAGLEFESTVDLAAYRLVQEGLTNVRRHAGRVSRVDVEIVGRTGALDVTSDDDGNGSSSGDPGGFGLVGLRERVDAVAGTLSAGPRADGGWRLAARLPARNVTVEPVATWGATS